MKETFSYKYRMAKKEMEENNVRNSLYIEVLVRGGIKVRPFQYGSITSNFIKLYPIWFVMFFTLASITDKELIGGFILNAIIVPLICSLCLAFFYYVQKKLKHLSHWEEL